MLKQRKRRIEKGVVDGSIEGSIWKLAAPMMISAALQDLFSLVDLYFIGKLGHIETAALSIAGTVSSVLLLLMQGIAVGTTMLVAHFTGEKRYEKADEVLGQTFILGAISSIIMLFVALFATQPLLKLFGARDNVLVYATDYLKITFEYSIVMFFFVGISQALQGTGDTKTPVKILVIANIANIILDPLLIMGYGFFPKMGVAGSAIATVITRGIGLVLLILHITIGNSTLQFNKIRYLKPNGLLMKKIITIGSFASLQVFIREVSFLLLMRLVAEFGAITLAAYGIGSRLRSLIMVPGMGFASAASILTGQNMGSNQPERATKSGWKTVEYYEFIILPVTIVFFIFAPQIVGVFSNHPQVIQMGATYLKFLAVTFPFLGFALVLSQAMNGAGDTLTPTIINTIGQLVIRIPIAYLFALTMKMGPTGIWLGINASDIGQGIGMAFVFHKGGWKKTHAKHKEDLKDLI